MSCGCYSTRSLTRVGAALLAFAGASFPATVVADPASKVYSPIVEYGETELEFRAGRLEDNDGNGDGEMDVSDAVQQLQYLFLGGPPHALGACCLPVAGCPTVPCGPAP